MGAAICRRKVLRRTYYIWRPEKFEKWDKLSEDNFQEIFLQGPCKLKTSQCCNCNCTLEN